MEKCICGAEFEKKRSLSVHGRWCSKYIKKPKFVKQNGGTCECGKSYDNSQSLNAHYRHCLIHRKGVKPIGTGGWHWHSSENAKEIHQRIAKKNAEIKRSRPGPPLSEERKKNLSIKRSEFLANNGGHCKFHELSNGVKVQGGWEKIVGERLIAMGIEFKRIRLSYDNTRNYTPDFYLPKHDIYIEVKGWWKDRDHEKMKKVLNEHDIDIRVIDTEEQIRKIEEVELRIEELLRYEDKYELLV